MRIANAISFSSWQHNSALRPNGSASVWLAGLAQNPTYGTGAEIAVPLTAQTSGGVVSAYQWATVESGDIAGAVTASFVPGDPQDGQTIFCQVTVDGAVKTTGTYPVRYAPPQAMAMVPDQAFTEGTGPQTVDASVNFSGADLSYALNANPAPAAIAIDAVSGIVSIDTDQIAPQSGMVIMVSAMNSGGTVSSSFLLDIGAASTIAANSVLPAISGNPEIGSTLSVDDGTWSGTQPISFANQWTRDGADIAGETGATLVLTSADDLSMIACRVSASNVAGTTDAIATAIQASYAAPVVAGALPDQSLSDAGGIVQVDAAAVFTGSALVFDLPGNPIPAAVSINISSGLISIDTGATGVQTATPIAVTAADSGGLVTVSFDLSVTAAATVPAAFGASDVSVTAETSANGDVIGIDVTNLPDDGGDPVTAIRYQVDSGSGFGSAQDLVGLGTGKRLVSVLAQTTAIVRIWQENAIGAGAPFDAPAVLPVQSGGGGGIPAAHTTVTNASSLNSLLSALDSNYSSIAASYGGSGTSDFYIDCASGNYGAVNLSNRNFPQVVHIRAADRSGGCFANGFTINASTNMYVEYFSCVSSGSDVPWLITGNSDNVLMISCEGLSHANAGQFASVSAFEVRGSGAARPQNCGFQSCYGGRSSNIFKFTECDNVVCIGNVAQETGADDFKLKDVDGGIVRDNWSSTVILAPSGAHSDFIQLWGNSSSDNVKNVTVQGNAGGAWEDPNPGSKPYRQMIMLTTTGQQNITIADNVVVASNTNGITCGASSGMNVHDNTVLFMRGTSGQPGNTTHTRINGGSGSFTNNVERASSGQGKAGSTFVTAGDYATYFGAVSQGGDSWSLIGVGGDFSDLRPQTGTIMHWNHAAPKGAHNRLREIFVDGLHPGNAGWPVAGAWQGGHNRHGRITS